MSEQPGMGASALHARVHFTNFIANFKLTIAIITNTDDAVCLSPITNIPLIKAVTLADDAIFSLILGKSCDADRSRRSFVPCIGSEEDLTFSEQCRLVATNTVVAGWSQLSARTGPEEGVRKRRSPALVLLNSCIRRPHCSYASDLGWAHSSLAITNAVVQRDLCGKPKLKLERRARFG